MIPTNIRKPGRQARPAVSRPSGGFIYELALFSAVVVMWTVFVLVVWNLPALVEMVP